MFVAVTPQNFRVYGSFGYGDIIFNDLKLPATKGTDLKQTMAQVSLEGLVAFQPDQMFIVNFGGEADKVYEDYKNSAVWKDNKAVKTIMYMKYQTKSSIRKLSIQSEKIC